MKCLFLYYNPAPYSKDLRYMTSDDESWMRIQGSSIHTGLASIAAVAAAHGVECRVFDTSSLPKREIGEAFRKELISYAPDIIGITVFTQYWNTIKMLLSAALTDYPVKRPLTIAGGPHSTAAPESVLSSNFIDIAVIGEGEIPFAGIIDVLRGNGSLCEVSGIRYKDGCEIRKGGVPVFVSSLDELPFPDWSVFVSSYLISPPPQSHRPSVGVFNSSRGCPYRCLFCQNDNYKNLYSSESTFHRELSPTHLIDEIEDKLQRYGFSQVVFLDETFIVNLDRLERIAELYVKRINLPCVVQTHPDTITHKSMSLLGKMGVVEMKVGIECGNERYRKEILGRDTPNRRLIERCKIPREYGISITSNNIIGLPFETRDMIVETIELNQILQVDHCCVNVFQPLPGTRLYDICVENDLFLENDHCNLGYGANRTVIKTLVSQEELDELKGMFPNVW